ncbi:S41 family peptidase [Thermohalobacter berrensis]|nr:S41 family peptidase [Thermohalobacter berrensis]
MKNITKKLSIMLLITLLIASTPFTTVYSEDNTTANEPEFINKNLDYIETMIQIIKSTYAGEVTEEELIEGAVNGMFDTLDEYSDYYTPEEFDQLQESTSGTYVGIGVHITQRDGYLTIIVPFEGSPGERAGLKPGDKIVTVDGQDITGMSTKKAASLIKGEAGTKVTLGILREGNAEILYIDVVREVIKVNPIKYEVLEDNIGYIRISQFNENTLENITKTLEEFDKEDIERLIVDLRNNPGGYLNEVVEVLRYFVPEGPIVHVKEPGGKIQTIKSNLKGPKYKIVVLVNEGSASASEIFAGAIKDTGVGKVVGTATYGKGTVQRIYPLVDGGAIKMTIAEYFTPNMNKVNGKGIQPDVVIENNPVTTIDIPELKYLNKERKLSIQTVGLDVLAAEKALDLLGYNLEKVDGVFDKETYNIVKKFQADKGLYSYGVLDFTTQDALINSLYEYEQAKDVDEQLQKAIEVVKSL